MSRTYKAIGINLKTMPLGESDRLLTILTREFGLVRAVAMGSRKHNSRLGGRSSLFVVNELLIAKGRSLDKITQADTLESYPGLGQDLKKLTASQYLAELSLFQALSEQPQEELFFLLNEHLKRLEQSTADLVLAHLTQAVFQLLILAGIAPQVHLCCVTREPITPDLSDPHWQIGFSIPTGGTVTLPVLEQLRAEQKPSKPQRNSQQPHVSASRQPHYEAIPTSVAEAGSTYAIRPQPASIAFNTQLTAIELFLLQHLAQAELPHLEGTNLPFSPATAHVWLGLERTLRQYAQYHFDRPIRSASLIDACFLPSVTLQPPEL